MTVKLRDLGLSYEQAAHGIQTAVLHDQNLYEAGRGKDSPPDHHPNGGKHLRVGLNLSKSDMLGLAMLLIQKGIITPEEYIEAMRLGANEELARYQELHPGLTFR